MILVLQFRENGSHRVDNFRRVVVTRGVAAHSIRIVIAIAVTRPKNCRDNGI
jgi:hypothetical protein